ncbi:protein of unknown function [Taphrina deformans PYCC 5710]|uniref:WSC domain-containing protein n=1 Tax=Taphrina deformans (strain PYCC 5710 / ATCC 11124 / CBS 356.35 / IMI 108563 / JCM 9778 / NBRC 8474) TaxID=1097556 RepID=R4XES0_TAPDE|nr:protein of unknown function [Taphrina deformans PYCC 5710]|eukprot:CCG82971.1 protein of unknown function [Taphrina deformans PYCC 5710]
MLFPTLLSIASLLALSNASPVAEKRADSTNLGCYLPAAVLGVPLILVNSMTVEVCRSFCAYQKTTYAALTAGTSCTCSNVLTDITSLNLGCDARCSGNAAQSCGGLFNTFQNVYLVAGAPPVSQSVGSATTTTLAATTSSAQAVSTTKTSTAQTSTAASTTSSAKTSATAQATSTSASAQSTASTTATSISATIIPTTTASSSRSSSTAAATTTSAIPTTAAIVTPVQTAGAISGYTLTQSGLTAAANGNGYLSAYLTTDGYNAAECAQSCTATSSCAFFNIYQQQSGSTFSDVCVLWQYVQSASDFNNFYNNGLPVSYSAGYAKIIPSVSSATTTAAQTTSTAAATTSAAQTTSAPAATTTAVQTSSTAARTTTSAAPVTTGTCSDAVTPAGYTAGFQCLSAAADGNGYLSSYIDSTATTYNQLVTDCAASCSLLSGCAFFNVYQENSRTTNICVLWNNVKDASTATNTYNNGVPISDSNGYIVSASVTSSATSTAAPTATATACTNALAPGYAVCYNGQRVVNGACVN